ncbi:MAG: FAD-binding oxidoreductase [Synechococcaceae cyanobacterium]|nr:FAD-binding oxidoreductase [Synechococcaceae cyanobacterium]
MRPEPHELPELVRELHRQGSPWLAAGLGSRLDWGPPVRQPCAVLSCARLDRIVEHTPGDFTIRVEAGAPLAAVQAALAPHRQWLAVDPAWGEAEGSLGGLVARGLAGGYRQRYLGVRDQLIGVRLLRADGVAAQAGGRVVKNVAGYDLMRLLTGSWGSLGLITELTLRTLPLPPHRRGLLVQGPAEALAPLVRWLLGSSLTPERVDLWSAPLAAAASLAAEPLLLIVLASVAAESVEEQAAAIAARSTLPIRALAAAELAPLLAVARGGASGAAVSGRPGPKAAAAGDWLLRLGVRPAACLALLEAPELAGLPLDLAAGSGLGTAWAPATPPAPETALAPERAEALRRRCRELGGWLTVLRQPEGADLPAWCDAPSRPLIEAIKRRFDPLGQLAPGRLPGVAAPLAGAPQPGSTR